MSEGEHIRALVSTTAALLDREDLDGWLALFDDAGIYEINAFSPEIGRTMSWWRSDRAALAKTLAELPQHERDPARRLRVLGQSVVAVEPGTASAETPFAVYRTTPDGSSALYVVGRYEDRLVRGAQGWRYRVHRAVLDTRRLDAFTHLPL